MRDSLFSRFSVRAGLSGPVSPPSVASAVQAIPYGRPALRTPEGVIREWRGTCSTKHLLLAELLAECWPRLRPRLVHRVYRIDPRSALDMFGTAAASVVPDGGLADVHRYLLIDLDGADVVIDVTFPGGPAWDGRTSMPLSCGDGEDFPAGADPDAGKAALEARYCDPRAREPFIAALSASAGGQQPSATAR